MRSALRGDIDLSAGDRTVDRVTAEYRPYQHTHGCFNNCQSCACLCHGDPATFWTKKVSMAEIRAGASERGGYSRAQLWEWGVPWPPPKGWKKRLAGSTRRTAASDRSLPQAIPPRADGRSNLPVETFRRYVAASRARRQGVRSKS